MNFFLINNVRKDYDNIKEEIKTLTLKQFIEYFSLFIKQCCCIVWNVEKIQKIKIQKFLRQKNGRIMFLSKCEVRDSKKSKSSRILNSLKIKTALIKISLVGPLLFEKILTINRLNEDVTWWNSKQIFINMR